MSSVRNASQWQKLVLVLAFVLTFALLLSRSADTQEKAKRTISEMKYYPKNVKPPVKIHKLKINNKQIDFSSMFEEGNKFLEKKVQPEAEFEEDDDFLEKMAFEVTNQSDKKITHIHFLLYMYTGEGLKRRQFDAGFHLFSGLIPEEGEVSPSIFLDPGETKPVSIPEERFPELRDRIKDIKSDIVRVGVYAYIVGFDDGSRWLFDGNYAPSSRKQKPNQSSLKGASVEYAAAKPVLSFSFNQTFASYSPRQLRACFKSPVQASRASINLIIET